MALKVGEAQRDASNTLASPAFTKLFLDGE